MLFIAEMIPLLLFYFIFADPDRFLLFSITPLGRLVAILIILFYTCIHMTYGFVVCVFVIFYYQTDMIESISEVKPMSATWTGSYETGSIFGNTNTTLKSASSGHDWDIFDWFEHDTTNTAQHYEGFVSSSPNNPDNPEKGSVCDRLLDIRLGEVQKLGQNQYTVETTPKVMVTPQNSTVIGEILEIHENLVYPKNTLNCDAKTDPYMERWFSHDLSKPYPTFGLLSNPYSVLPQ